jgi:hypothetical protein
MEIGYWILLIVAITFYTLWVAGAFKRKNSDKKEKTETSEGGEGKK